MTGLEKNTIHHTNHISSPSMTAADIFTSIRDQTRKVADLHSGLAKTVDSSIVQHLHRLNAEIKAHIKNIQLDTGKLADQVAVQRELSTTLIAQLAKR